MSVADNKGANSVEGNGRQTRHGAVVPKDARSIINEDAVDVWIPFESTGL